MIRFTRTLSSAVVLTISILLGATGVLSVAVGRVAPTLILVAAAAATAWLAFRLGRLDSPTRA